MNEASKPEELSHRTDRGVEHLYEAKAEFVGLAAETGRSPKGRAYNIIVTDLEKLIFVAQGYLQKRETI